MRKISNKKLLNNKGIAIESVIFAMIVILMLCTLLVFISMRFATMSKFNKDSISERLYLDQIADDYLNHINNNDDFNKSDYEYRDDDDKQDYYITISETENQKTLVANKKYTTEDENGVIKVVQEVVLNVVFKFENNKYIVQKWSYGE